MENNMKQFNLQEYLAHPERRLVTRDGRETRIVCTDLKGSSMPILGLVKNPEKFEEKVISYTPEGRAAYLTKDFDLFFAPTIVKRWGIVYRKAERLFDTREQAEKWMEEADEGEKKFCSVCKVEWEEE